MKSNYQSLLTEFVALESVSTDPAFQDQIERTVAWLIKLFERNGFEVSLLKDPKCNPVIVARYDAGKAQTALVYGHYDVQPASLEQGWKGNPFKLREVAGRLIGRGVVDNKGQVLVHMVTVFELIKKQSLGKNVIFLIEGNEETGNEVLPDLLAKNRQQLKCDEIIISDGEILGDQPTLEAGLRGGSNLNVKLRTGKTDLHSGLVGGAVPNAAKVLSDLLAELFDQKGAVKVPGFYEGVDSIDQEVAVANSQLAAAETPAKQGVKKFLLANETDFYTQTGLFPTLQITGLSSGYSGEGFANIVPATAEARLNLRTVASQNSAEIARKVANWIRKLVPDYTEIEIDAGSPYPAVKLDVESGNARQARQLLKQIYGKEPAIKYIGGSIPVVADFKQMFKIDPLMISFGNDDCNMHGAEENFRIDLIKKAQEFSRAWFGG